MGRIRTVKPELFESGTLAACSRDARLVFVGLLTIADDHGRLKDLPKKLVGELFPHDDDVTPVVLSSWLDELENVDSIRRYSSGGDSFIYLPMWEQHQKISHRSPSRLPDPPEFLRKVSGEAPEEILEPPELLRSDLGKGSRKGILDLGGGLGKVSGEPPETTGAVPVAASPEEDLELPKSLPKSRLKRATQVPEDFELTPELQVWASGVGFRGDLVAETSQFLDYYRATGRNMKDWTAAWRSWIRKEVKMRPRPRGQPNDGLSSNEFFRMIQEDSVGRIAGGTTKIVDVEFENRNPDLPWNRPRALGLASEDS